MASFQVGVLGAFRLEVDATPRQLRSVKAQALLTYLALRSLPSYRRDAVASLLWSHVSASQARHSLRQTILAIRSLVTDARVPLIVGEGDTIALNRAALTVDALTFVQLATSGLAEDVEPAATLYTGELLEGMHLNEPAFDHWLAAERVRLHELAIDALSRQLARLLDEGPADRAIATALRLLALEPLLEWVHRALIVLYEREGRLGAALQQYNHCARLIHQELGIEPELETRRLCQQLLRARARSRPPTTTSSRHPLTSKTTARPSNTKGHVKGSVIALQVPAVTRAMLERILAGARYTLTAAKTVTEAIAMAKGRHKPIVLTGDDSARGRTELVSALDSERIDVPVIVITDELPRLPRAHSHRLAFVRRPVRAEALLETMAAVMGDQKPTR